MRAIKITIDTGALLFAAAVFTGSLIASQGLSERDRRSGFGRPETITGTILVVDSSRGVVILSGRVSGPPSTQVTVAQKVAPDGTTEDQSTTFSEVPGEADYKFKVSNSTLITLDGQRVALAELAGLTGRGATVRCVPQRSGNYALGIEVSR